MARFKTGQSGNPAGRPKGITDNRTKLRELLQPHAENLVNQVVVMALGGDTMALKICIDRLIPPIREDRISIGLPKLSGAAACVEAQGSVIAAVAAGELLPAEGTALSALIENQRRSYETLAIEERLRALEDRLGADR